MKFRSLKNWTDPSNSEGLIFFAQLLEELLFDYSLDTYKPSAMNSSMLCLEAISLVKDIEEGLIEKANINHVLKELTLNLKKDEVVKNLLPIKIETISAKFMADNTPILEIATILELIFAQIEPHKYKSETERLLTDAISTPHEKGRIRALTRNYVTTLINMGYSTRFLYPCARMYFYWNNEKTIDSNSLSGFIDLVSAKPQSYLAVFKVSDLFNEIKDSCKEFKVEISSQLPNDVTDLIENKTLLLDDGEIFLLAREISAMDVFSARDVAERRMEQISTLYSLYHHKEAAKWNRNALLINLETKKDRMVSASNNPMLMCADSRKEDAAIKLNSFINDFSLEPNSFKKFNRAAELHSLALRSESPENQLLNLWVALETIVPSKTSQHKAKINNIIDSVLPFLSLIYIELLTDKLVHDFYIWKKSIFNQAILGIDGSCDRHKMLRLLLLAENQEKRNFLYQELKDFHLLRNRAHYFSTALNSSLKLAKLLENHWQRVDWQIRRIYRTRNLIIHAGHTPSYISVLIKNNHDYLDVVLKTIGKLASDGNKFNSIDGAFKYTDLKYHEHLDLLRNKDEPITESNIEKFIFDIKI